MSTHILDNLAAIKIPAARSGHWDDLYILAAEGGDNNTFVSATGKRARDWYPLAIGPAWKVMGELVHYAASMEGGMLKLAGNSKATAETLISRGRKVVTAAPDYDDPNRAFYLRDTAITYTAAEKAARQYDFEKAVKARGEPTKTKNWLRGDGELDSFDFNLESATAADMALFLTLIPASAKELWHHFKVRPLAN